MSITIDDIEPRSQATSRSRKPVPNELEKLHSLEGLLVGCAKNWKPIGMELADAIQEANIIALKVIRCFDESRGFRLTTPVVHAVSRHFVRLRDKEKLRAKLWHQSEILERADESKDFEKVVIDRELFESAMAMMPESYQYLVTEYYLNGRSLSDLSNDIGENRYAIKQTLETILDTLRDLAAGESTIEQTARVFQRGRLINATKRKQS